MSTMTATLASFSLPGAGGEPGWAMLGWAAPGRVSCLVIQRSPSLAFVLLFSTTRNNKERFYYQYRNNEINFSKRTNFLVLYIYGYIEAVESIDIYT